MCNLIGVNLPRLFHEQVQYSLLISTAIAFLSDDKLFKSFFQVWFGLGDEPCDTVCDWSAGRYYHPISVLYTLFRANDSEFGLYWADSPLLTKSMIGHQDFIISPSAFNR